MGTDDFHPTGVCFHRTWHKRISLLAAGVARLVDARQALPRHYEEDPLAFLESMLRQHGAFPIIKASCDITPLPGFDPISLIMQQSPTMVAVVRRWRSVVTHQTDAYHARTGEHTAPNLNLDELVDIEKQSLYFNPSGFSLSSGSPVLPAMFTGIMLGVFRDFHLSSFDCFQLTSPTRSTKIIAGGKFVSHDTVEHAPWVISWTGDIKNRVSGAYLVRKDALPFASFLDGYPTPFIHKVAALLANEGPAISISQAARKLNVSDRTFSRRMATMGISYKSLVRLSRFQQACLSFAKGETNIDDIAFDHNFSDRQHMSREFRYFGALSPAFFRGALHIR